MLKKSDIFDDVQTIMFCDESKFAINDGNTEDAIYYFGISVPKNIVPEVNSELEQLMNKYTIQARIFHASTIFKEKRPRADLMEAIGALIVYYRLNCFCSKYHKQQLFDLTKQLSYLNDGYVINFDNLEFQALFYFVSLFRTHLANGADELLKRKILLFFDRNVFGRYENEELNFREEDYFIKRLAFVNKADVRLLALADFYGFLFRKSKISVNKVQFGDKSLETSRLTIHAYHVISKISSAGLFHFLDIDKGMHGTLK